MKAPLVAPSLLSADFAQLGEEIRILDKLDIDWLHCDVMDGVFVPNISFGLPIVTAIRRLTQKPLDVHLMIVHPERYLAPFAEAGADILTFHWEATPHPDRLVQEIHRLGKKAGIAINPATPVEVLREILPEIDVVCIMSVNPGFGGQKFIPYVAQKGHRLARLRAETGSRALLEVDGGVSLETAPLVPWADVLVAGQAFFQSKDRSAFVESLRKATIRIT